MNVPMRKCFNSRKEVARCDFFLRRARDVERKICSVSVVVVVIKERTLYMNEPHGAKDGDCSRRENIGFAFCMASRSHTNVGSVR